MNQTLQPLVWRRHVLVLGAYVAVAILFSWPLPRHLQTHLPGSPDGDTGVYVWNLWVFQHELLDHGTLPYFTDRIFAATGRANLSLHNYTAFANVLALPLVRVLGVVATFNVVYLTLTVLVAYAMYLLAVKLSDGDTAVSWLAGVLFAWCPALVTRGMGHFSLVAAAPLPIFILLLLRVGERRSLRNAIALGVTVAWATACDVYYGVFCVMLATAYLTASSFRIIRSEATITPIRLVVTRGIDVLTISLAGLVLALMISQGWQFTLMGRIVRVRTLYTPLLVLTILVGLRFLLHYRPTLRPVSGSRLATRLRVLAGTGIVAAVLMSPLLYAFGVRLLEGRGDRSRIFWRSSPAGIDALALVTPNPNHPLAPAALRDWLAQLSRNGYLENVASIPFVALAVVLLAWRYSRSSPFDKLRATLSGVEGSRLAPGGARLFSQGPRCDAGVAPRGARAPVVAAAIALGFGALALGPFLRIAGVDTHIPAPWAFLRYLPVVGLARSPSRFFILAMVGVAALFALALHALLLRAPGASARRATLAVVAVALFAELLPAPRILFSAEIPPIYRVVASDPREVRVLELPFGIRDGTMAVGNFTSRTQFYQTAHGKPIIGGYLSRVSRRRVRDNERHPVLSALIRLSEGKRLTSRQAEDFRRSWPAFVQHASIGYVVVDRNRASEELRSMAVTALGLEPLAEHGPLVLYRPALSRQ